jgi:uncharacterized protein
MDVTRHEKQRAAVVVDTRSSPGAALWPVAAPSVKFADPILAPARQRNRERMIPSQLERCEATGRLANFSRAAGLTEGPFQGRYYNDSDVYKWLEGAAWSLASEPDPVLEAKVEALIATIAAAQRPDGYLNTYFARERAEERWTNLKDMHELYLAGHLFEAAVAHYRATGRRSLLDVAVKFADHIDATFGDGPGRIAGTCGHPEIELALVELARATGNRRYLDLARTFLDARGRKLAGGDEEHVDHLPFRELPRLTGHAVRALYLASGGVNVATDDDDRNLRRHVEELRARLDAEAVYVTGGVGSRHDREAIGDPYELPADRAYAETCAAIASAMFSYRLLLLTGDARHSDAFETTLYNAILPGVSLVADHYFYVNPLADSGTHRRTPWFTCACCPPNLARFLASLPGLAYALRGDSIVVNLYAAGDANLELPDGRSVNLRQEGAYPWDGRVTFTVQGEGAFGLELRIPAWSDGARVGVNGADVPSAAPGEFLELRREWRPGDRVTVDLAMRPTRVHAHPFVTDATGRVALRRGPIVYCVEQADHGDADLRQLVLPAEALLEAVPRPDLLGGIVTLTAKAELFEPEATALYQTSARSPGKRREITLTAIPYYAWANRGAGRMAVWVRER